MYSALKKAAGLYRLYFSKVFWSILLFALPIQILNTFFVNYVSAPFQLFGNQLWTSIIQVLFIFIALPLLEIPFISILKQDAEDDDVSFGKVLDDFFAKAPKIYVAGALAAIAIAAGLILFLIPGIILAFFLLAFTQVLFLREGRPWRAVKRTMKFTRESFGKILVLLLLFILVDFILSSTVFFLSVGLASSFFIINLALLFMNSFIMPLFIFSLTYLYVDWEMERNEMQVLGKQFSFTN
ncbi:hypothetical protein [Bacillus sp. FJAT-27445]|uniref:hypothetical protein n=1 Tax=Bacillus sp. FJAT-27445 TaxID=1679166 RepID=UPI00074367B7|nr:hypothetical protein [Bacillus sp. FJAT-27445]